MDVSTKPKRIPWVPLVLMIPIAGSAVFVHVYFNGAREIDPANVTFATLISLTAFLIMRFLLNSFWGLVAAGLTIAHSLFRFCVQGGQFDLLAEWLMLAAMLGVVLMWTIAFQSRRRFFALICLGLVQSVVVGWAWLTSPRAGCVAASLTVLGLLFAGILSVLRKRRLALEDRPAILNIVLTCVLTVIVPAASLAVAFGLSQATHALIERKLEHWQQVIARPLPANGGVEDLLRNSFLHETEIIFPDFFTHPSDVPPWHWPNRWAVPALTALGLFRAFRRGWVQCRNGQPAVAWVLLLFVVVQLPAMILHAGDVKAIYYLPLAMVAVLLSVFGAADLLRSMSQRMVLSPPIGNRDQSNTSDREK